MHTHSTLSVITEVDYGPSGPLTVTFDVGSGDATVVTAMISAVEDMDVEGDHDFTVSIQSTSPSVMLGTNSMTATIVDDDRKFGFNLWCE